MEKLIRENEDMLNAENRIVDQELKARTTETEINAHLSLFPNVQENGSFAEEFKNSNFREGYADMVTINSKRSSIDHHQS